MVIETVKKNENIIHRNIFDNLYEMVNYIKTTDPFEDKWKMMSVCENADRTRFTGVSSLDEALNLCLNGYKENFGELLFEIEALRNLLPMVTNKRRTQSSVYGFRPNINKLMTGNPNSMYKLVRKEENNFADLYFNVSCSWTTSHDAIRNKGIITIALIKFLEQLNIRVNLNFFELTKEFNEYIYINVILKSPGQLLDTSICNFPICHPAFLRRICFAIAERVEIRDPYDWYGYGTICDSDDVVETMNPDKNSLLLLAPEHLGVCGEATDFNKILTNNQRLEFDEKQKKFILTR